MQPKTLINREELTEIFKTEMESLRRQLTAEFNRKTKEIIKAINSRNVDGLDIKGPRTAECREQVMAVVAFLANPKHWQSIYHACNITFRFCTGGYDDAERLYLWCHRNESRIWAWVETYRLDHDLDWPPINTYQN